MRELLDLGAHDGGFGDVAIQAGNLRTTQMGRFRICHAILRRPLSWSDTELVEACEEWVTAMQD